MALSEFEQRKLDEIERALHRDDPGFASAIKTSAIKMGAMRRHGRFVAVVVFVVGLLALVAGVVLAQGLPLVGVAVSVLGFVVMVAGAGLFVSGRPGAGGNAGDAGAHRGSTRRSRMEDRLRHRFDHPDE